MNLIFSILFLITPVFILTGVTNNVNTSQQKEFLLNRYVRSRRENSIHNISSSIKNFSVAASKALHSVRLSLRQLRVVLLNTFLPATDPGVSAMKGSTVFQIVPCHHYFLRIGILLIWADPFGDSYLSGCYTPDSLIYSRYLLKS